MNKILITLIIAIVSIGPAIAASSITPDQIVKDITPGGSVDFTLTLRTTDGSGKLKWNINGAEPINAKISSEPFSKHGYVDVIVPPGTQTFTLTVQAGSGLVQGEEYEVQVDYEVPGSTLSGPTLRARATVGVAPVPELSTSILISVGLIGLLGLVRWRRNNK